MIRRPSRSAGFSWRLPTFALLAILALTCAVPADAQRRDRRDDRDRDRRNTPEWTVDPAFQNDVFSFARLRYESWGGSWGGWGGWGGGRGRWATDAPDADLNLMFRLQQMTALKVNPEVTYIDIEPEQLRHYPFVYMVEPGRLMFRDEEVTALRDYLLNGGFIMLDDFWGEEDWDNVRREFARVFPDRDPVELEIDHPIFHIIFDLDEKPQMPGIDFYMRGGRSDERNSGPPHYWAYYDDKGRMMAIFCHNTDLGDGWEREGEDPTYFRRFAEKMAYPMAINIIYYAMTH
ncbi:DUF4159 domain-containing protein [Actomonas aquatica]|uniref:DUF4159 domain-containing protein n=1 Tax=Actomonas aquatica TaxID=2866162 RepID=A0ABZ1CBP7_9BACT|nr:DUF4159 domain-containing protein [Opitutus sp. WL0086]WRQ87999.1 DUF4159 domain-containing protein [Opitutus sp. WL0086]